MPDHPEAAAKLRKAVRDLNKVFGRYRGMSDWADALDELSSERESRPARLPVRDLSREDVEYFFRHAVCGDPKDRLKDELNAIRYFLPRVFEDNCREERLADEARCQVYDWRFIGELMRHAAWHAWPTKERGPIHCWFEAWLEAILLHQAAPPAADCERWRGAPPNRKLEAWLDAVSELDVETAGYLPQLESINDQLLPSLVDAMIFKRLNHPAGKGFFWETDDPSRQLPLAEWLLRRKTSERLEEVFFRCDDSGIAQRLSATLELLEGIRQSLHLAR